MPCRCSGYQRISAHVLLVISLSFGGAAVIKRGKFHGLLGKNYANLRKMEVWGSMTLEDLIKPCLESKHRVYGANLTLWWREFSKENISTSVASWSVVGTQRRVV